MGQMLYKHFSIIFTTIYSMVTMILTSQMRKLRFRAVIYLFKDIQLVNSRIEMKTSDLPWAPVFSVLHFLYPYCNSAACWALELIQTLGKRDVVRSSSLNDTIKLSLEPPEPLGIQEPFPTLGSW